METHGKDRRELVERYTDCTALLAGEDVGAVLAIKRSPRELREYGGALVGAVTEHLEKRLGSLFPASGEDVLSAFKGLHTAKAFGEFGRAFFGKLTHKCMDYFLTKTLGTHVGAGHRFQTMNQMSEFQRAMEIHCHESSKIVEDFCGDWFSKHRFEEGGDISRHSAEKFGWFAIEKMKKEFTYEGQDNGN